MKMQVIAVAVCIGSLGCMIPKPASRPPVGPGLDPDAKAKLYEDYKLQDQTESFPRRWARKDGQYTYPELAPLLDEYPSTREINGQIAMRGAVLGAISGLGGGLIGATLGWNLTADPSLRWSSETQIATYSIGGALVVAGLVAALLWHPPVDQIAETYNRALHDELQLGQPQSFQFHILPLVTTSERGSAHGVALSGRF